MILASACHPGGVLWGVSAILPEMRLPRAFRLLALWIVNFGFLRPCLSSIVRKYFSLAVNGRMSPVHQIYPIPHTMQMNLFGLDQLSELDRRDIARRGLNNLLTSYADEADLFAEIIQNALDSVVLAMKSALYKADERPELTIVIGRRQGAKHYIYVCDNGIGMSSEIARNITVPGFSHGKRRGITIGYKGVGASYFFAASQCAALRTIAQDGKGTEYTVRNSFNWIRNEGEKLPEIIEKAEVPTFVQTLLPTTRGTGIYIEFHHDLRPRDLNSLVIVGKGPTQELRNWMSFLATKTALGSVENRSAMNIKVNACLDLGDTQETQTWSLGEYDTDILQIGYPFPQKVFKVGKNAIEIDKVPIHERYKHDKKHQAIFRRWTAEDIIKETSLETGERETLEKYLMWVEGYFCYSTDVFRTIAERMGGRGHLIKHGIRIACDGTPQGRMIDLSLTSSQGLDRQTHIVMAFDRLELDTGRKISADEMIATAINKVGQRVVAILKEYRWAMKKKNRPDVTSDLEAWKKDIEARAKDSLVREFFTQLGKPAVFKVDPSNEAELIALFVSLMTHHIIKGYRLQAISGFSRYDALIDIEQPNSENADVNDWLSLRDRDSSLSGEALVLEFKYSFDELLTDFDEKKKSPAEIDILVCWTVPDLNVSMGTLSPTYAKWRDSRSVYGATYRWEDENQVNSFQVIALHNVVAEWLAAHESRKGRQGLGQATLNRLQTDDEHGLV